MRFSEYVKIKNEAVDEISAINESNSATEGVLNEASDILKNIFGFMRLKSMRAKLVKAMADEGAADLDFERKKRAGIDPKKREVLDAANKQKKDQLSEVTSAINDKIDNIATTDYLKSLAKRVKAEAKMEKAKLLLKIANETEAKELSLKIKKYKEGILNADKELAEYQKTNAAKIKEESGKELESVKKDISKVDKEIGKINDQLDSLGEDVETANKKVELLANKIELTKKLAELKSMANALHSASDAEGDPPYDDESQAEELENLVKKLEDAKESAKREEDASKEEPKEEEPKEEPKEEPAEEPKEEEPAEEPKEESEEVKKQKESIESKKKEIDDLKQALEDLGKDPKKNKDKISTIEAAVRGKENLLKKEEDKLAELTSKDNNSVASKLPKKFMKFEEYIAHKQINK